MHIRYSRVREATIHESILRWPRFCAHSTLQDPIQLVPPPPSSSSSSSSSLSFFALPSYFIIIIFFTLSLFPLLFFRSAHRNCYSFILSSLITSSPHPKTSPPLIFQKKKAPIRLVSFLGPLRHPSILAVVVIAPLSAAALPNCPLPSPLPAPYTRRRLAIHWQTDTAK
ncbi:hypothetical protein L249_1726 [Ophiocordyceps polyrhachis-furcata BCC 54312]|uniref:Uncharacterized protein n=1 Tax=Ophiocordyceps polyrhachis-furcata BCC 54312 TaxID=1330021 RepID=A0A367LPF2_9HYPO|nr:hypothetical protein L249_1726 [Ophiocordyceps polyrhachis-furcata BCC 54312]